MAAPLDVVLVEVGGDVTLHFLVAFEMNKQWFMEHRRAWISVVEFRLLIPYCSQNRKIKVRMVCFSTPELQCIRVNHLGFVAPDPWHIQTVPESSIWSPVASVIISFQNFHLENIWYQVFRVQLWGVSNRDADRNEIICKCLWQCWGEMAEWIRGIKCVVT